MSSIVALNAGSIKVKQMSAYGSSTSLSIGSNISVTGNLTVGNELIVLSTEDSTDISNGGLRVQGGLGVKKKFEYWR